ncbi:uncharacterized protein LY89DRAFT_719253 [Mollisia scopiformis]|uniref:Uncharacterized protein n=1 Tax=Mollisia scopiformis TaxID=149040 RepID=A0A194X9V7_MOLSC|nr:uncharacterized protein LY89DRAFT_719253 [Mollisia scopiformis]KUJ16557.1 hypothetical protein LY89DRAFT_719253 [Mollisia scopiformis]
MSTTSLDKSEGIPDIIRQYTIANSKNRHVHHVFEPSSSIALYTIHTGNIKTKNHKYNLTIHSGCSEQDPIVGAARLSMITNTIKLTFGDPETKCPRWEDMERKLWVGKNQYMLCIDLPTGERRLFEWRMTHDVHDIPQSPFAFVRKVDAFTYKIDHRHLKLVDLESGGIVARFMHCPLTWPGKMGDVEILCDLGGRKWDEIVILSSLAIQAAQ